MPIKEDVTKRLEALDRFFDRMPDIMGSEAVKFSKMRFEEQGWRDGSFNPWPRKKVDNNYPTLRSKNSAGLVDTIHYQKMGPRSVVVRAGGSLKPYARIHNEGGVTHPSVTPKSRAWARAMFLKTRNPMYMAMSLTRKTKLTVVIPKRQYIGNSRDLTEGIKNVLLTGIKRIMS